MLADIKHIILLIILILLSFRPQAQISTLAQEKPILLRGIKIWVKARRVETQGVVNMRSGVVELLATAPGGKEHESILVLNCNPALLQSSLLLIKFTPRGANYSIKNHSKMDGVYIYIQWQHNKRLYSIRAEKAIWDRKHSRPMSLTSWIFTGSRFRRSKNGKKIFMANINGVLVATLYDLDAVINNPLPERTDDTVYCANEKILPAKGTPVKIIFTAKPLEKE